MGNPLNTNKEEHTKILTGVKDMIHAQKIRENKPHNQYPIDT
jgi:hypothetical protein